jgi:hypothetical protein
MKIYANDPSVAITNNIFEIPENSLKKYIEKYNMQNMK